MYAPVRKIPTQTRSVRGSMPGIGDYESALERDFMTLMRFDKGVTKVIPQPVSISFGSRSYTPDGLVYFDENFVADPSPILYEIKYREDLRNDRRTLFPKFRVAKKYALEKGWRFEVFTERHIRTPFLKNAEFLLGYSHLEPTFQTKSYVLNLLEDESEITVSHLLCALCETREQQANILPFIWHLVGNNSIGCDLDVPLTMSSVIWKGGIT
jgi:TnsA-like endonuclease N terminal/TnsA endonuclease C terminal